MIVTSVQIKTAKTQKHLYCPVFTKKEVSFSTLPFFDLNRRDENKSELCEAQETRGSKFICEFGRNSTVYCFVASGYFNIKNMLII